MLLKKIGSHLIQSIHLAGGLFQQSRSRLIGGGVQPGIGLPAKCYENIGKTACHQQDD